jgi:ribosomal protein S18 acetylase RimI-like enzyme
MKSRNLERISCRFMTDGEAEPRTESLRSLDMVTYPESAHDVYVVLAYCKDQVIGLQRMVKRRNRISAQSLGTWVRRDFRRRGVATRMWQLMLRRLQPRNVTVIVVTDRGFTLTNRLQMYAKKKDIKLHIIEDGYRNLRDLRKRC